jgi:hypothetical protein
MARGAIVYQGNVVAVTDAASGYDPNYQGPGVAFVPDLFAQVGDLYNGTAFTYVVPPPDVTALQARQAINAAGLRPNVNAAIAGADQNTQDFWALAPMFQRSNPIIASISTALGLTSGQIDNLFRLASTF